jgi:hypothetical protein
VSELKLIYSLIACVPEFIKLLQAILQAAQEQEIQRRVKDDVKALHLAISSGNADGINHLFANRVSDH